eukprot:5210632-Alexandrium_andersonii.AAC.1
MSSQVSLAQEQIQGMKGAPSCEVSVSVVAPGPVHGTALKVLGRQEGAANFKIVRPLGIHMGTLCDILTLSGG